MLSVLPIMGTSRQNYTEVHPTPFSSQTGKRRAKERKEPPTITASQHITLEAIEVTTLHYIFTMSDPDTNKIAKEKSSPNNDKNDDDSSAISELISKSNIYCYCTNQTSCKLCGKPLPDAETTRRRPIELGSTDRRDAHSVDR